MTAISSSRQDAIKSVISKPPTPQSYNYETDPTGVTFGANTFNKAVMKKVLSPEVYEKLIKTIDDGSKIDLTIADEVADAMMKWAMAKGATHFTHVFYPLTGCTAEKHDSFYDPGSDGATAISKFKGKTLLQGEPDASSFPNGGIRATHTARGYTVWDPTSPAYISENPYGTTLCIPTSFVSWTGESLDKKTPVLKSMQALDKQARRILKLFGHSEISHVSSTAGPEQEYFLIDKAFYYARPDLMATNRTCFGAPAPKGQEFDDHYFGAIPERVMSFMFELDRELFKLGIPSKTRHNEVAPGQFELAPMFESANVASDHQQLVMTTLKKLADRHGFACLMHEKPFAGVNGSGKHVNWSVGNKTQGNLFDPGDTPHENAQFLLFAGAVIQSVDKYAKLLRAVVASAGNDHRLGANEAPPAIISIFLGDQLADVFEQIKNGGATTSRAKGILNVGVDSLPELTKDAGDRNRTSPFAFTGNRFEFRAVGSNSSISGALVAMNTMLCESLDEIATRLEGSSDRNAELQIILQEIMTKHGKVIFNGNGYSDEWHAEAAERGLPCLTTTADALPEITSPEVIALFEKYSVLTERELHSRQEIYEEQYCASVNVEANVVTEMAKTMIYPAAVRYLGELAGAAASMKAAGIKPENSILKSLQTKVNKLDAAISNLESVHAAAGEETQKWAKEVLPAMLEVRSICDDLETIVADDLWPIPTYQEMLFIK
ncbi:MAG: glutamine synthetase III [Verrucomicrobiales bacterium]|nr:glutamine synthetase III [Verrucomicrobiales bacterium]